MIVSLIQLTCSRWMYYNIKITPTCTCTMSYITWMHATLATQHMHKIKIATLQHYMHACITVQHMHACMQHWYNIWSTCTATHATLQHMIGKHITRNIATLATHCPCTATLPCNIATLQHVHGISSHATLETLQRMQQQMHITCKLQHACMYMYKMQHVLQHYICHIYSVVHICVYIIPVQDLQHMQHCNTWYTHHMQH